MLDAEEHSTTCDAMFRFTIRDVLWLMVVVGILCAWWMEDAEQYVSYRELYAGKASLKGQLDALNKRARSDPALKADAEQLKAAAMRQIREDVAEQMELFRRYRDLKSKVDALPAPEPSPFDEWPPEPPWGTGK